MPTTAVSVRQFEPLLRKHRGWGSTRLAVEGKHSIVHVHVSCNMIHCCHFY